MEIKKIVYSILFSSALVIQGYSQKASVAAADKKYDRYAFVDAIATYERVANKGYKDSNMFQKLGNAYYFNGELEKAGKWYEQLFAMSNEQEAEYYYRYSQCLKAKGDYAKADEMLDGFNQKSGNDLRAKLFLNNKNYLQQIKANSGRFLIEDAGINSRFSDYGSSFLGSKLVFASARDTGGFTKKIFKWNKQYFTNLYTSEVDSVGGVGKPERISKKINSKFHESTPVFTKDGKTMYFTRNNFLEGKRGKSATKNTLLKLYKATLSKKGDWENVIELSFNSNEYSLAHPTLSVDDKTLYFASDMPGTLGESDLFKVAINNDGSYGKPENLGNKINTEGRETFPYINDDNELYYATDGRPGLGGLDIFVANIAPDGTISESQNVGEPVNGKADDFAFFITGKNRKGYFTSNREGGKGNDDIYKLTETKRLICEQELAGIVTDQGDGKLLPNTQVILLDSKFKEIQQTISDSNAHYAFTVTCGGEYYVRAIKTDYETKEQRIVVGKESVKTDLPMALEKSMCKVAVGDDLGKCFGIKMIYFDLDKATVRNEAAFELEKILDVMKQYPDMKIDILSYTDSRQTAAYNEKLSDRRAKATIAWLVKNGIVAERLTGKGYGETQLVNHCADNVECSEEEHQANRRSEFIISAM